MKNDNWKTWIIGSLIGFFLGVGGMYFSIHSSVTYAVTRIDESQKTNLQSMSNRIQDLNLSLQSVKQETESLKTKLETESNIRDMEMRGMRDVLVEVRRDLRLLLDAQRRGSRSPVLPEPDSSPLCYEIRRYHWTGYDGAQKPRSRDLGR